MKQKFLSLAVVLGVSALASAAMGDERFVDRSVEAFSRDKIFEQVLETVSAGAKDASVELSKLSPENRKNVGKALRAFSQQKSASPKNVPANLKPYLRLPQSLMDKLSNAVKRLAKLHPAIRQPAHVGQAYLFGFYNSEYSFSDIEPDYCSTEVCRCQSNCREEYRLAANAAGLMWVTRSLSELTPSAPFLNYVKLVLELSELQAEMVECGISCRGRLNDGQCRTESDCRADEYCRKPFGNPYHSCTPKKSQGQACSSHSKCASGCCKYHLPTNPVQMVCRPADRCD